MPAMDNFEHDTVSRRIIQAYGGEKPALCFEAKKERPYALTNKPETEDIGSR
jgi:hypothetical protein